MQACYKGFQDKLMATLADYSEPIDGVVETVAALKAQGIKLGSTTGYTKTMMDIVIKAAAEKGYTVDNCVTSDNMPGDVRSHT